MAKIYGGLQTEVADDVFSLFLEFFDIVALITPFTDAEYGDKGDGFHLYLLASKATTIKNIVYTTLELDCFLSIFLLASLLPWNNFT